MHLFCGMSIYIVDNKYLREFDRKQFIWATYNGGCYGAYNIKLFCTVCTRDEVNYYLIVIKYIYNYSYVIHLDGTSARLTIRPVIEPSLYVPHFYGCLKKYLNKIFYFY